MFEKLDAIAERVAELEPVVSGDRNAVDHLATYTNELFPPRVEIFDQISQMPARLSAVDAVLDSEMNLKFSELKPKSTAAGERLWLRYFNEAKHAAIKVASLVFRTNRNTDLDVMSGSKHKAILTGEAAGNADVKKRTFRIAISASSATSAFNLLSCRVSPAYGLRRVQE